jgi:hypothetical protein
MIKTIKINQIQSIDLFDTFYSNKESSSVDSLHS